MDIVAQVSEEVKCSVEGCGEPTFRQGGLCFDHFIEEQTAEWDARDAEREICQAGVGYLFGDPVEVMA